LRRGRSRIWRRIARLLRCGRRDRLRHGRARRCLRRGRLSRRGGLWTRRCGSAWCRLCGRRCCCRHNRRLRRLLAQHWMFFWHGRLARLRRLTGLRRRLCSGRSRSRRIDRIPCRIRREAAVLGIGVLGIRALGILTISARRLVHGHERAFAAENAVTVMLLPTIPTCPETLFFRALVVFLIYRPYRERFEIRERSYKPSSARGELIPSPQFAARRKITDAFVPPKPKELDSAKLISRLRA
jgi:hypothetical protein